MRRRPGMAMRLVLPLLAAAAAAPASAQKIEVFALSTLPVANAEGATVVHLDALQQLEHGLSAGLPAQAQAAQALLQSRLAAMGPDLHHRLRAAGSGLGRALALGIDRAPAVVFDGRWTVYGVPDVAAARQLYRQRRP